MGNILFLEHNAAPTELVSIGYYSQAHANFQGYYIYETPVGTQVKITNVTAGIPKVQLTPYMWPDAINVGPVTNFISKHKCVNSEIIDIIP